MASMLTGRRGVGESAAAGRGPGPQATPPPRERRPRFLPPRQGTLQSPQRGLQRYSPRRGAGLDGQVCARGQPNCDRARSRWGVRAPPSPRHSPACRGPTGRFQLGLPRPPILDSLREAEPRPLKPPAGPWSERTLFERWGSRWLGTPISPPQPPRPGFYAGSRKAERRQRRSATRRR